MEIELPLTESQIRRVDDRQDAAMTRDSPDGRPPTHRQLFLQWWIVALLAFIVLVVGAAMAIGYGLEPSGVVLGALLCIMYFLLAAWPAWGAGLLCRQEERAAREKAIVEVRLTADPERRVQPPV
jgi:hypothetical protein